MLLPFAEPFGGVACAKVSTKENFRVDAASFHNTTASLHVTEIQWSDVAITASVEFGRVSTRPSLKKRFSFDFISNAVDDLLDPISLSDTTSIDHLFEPRLKIYPLPDVLSGIKIGFPFEIPYIWSKPSQNNDTSSGLQVTCVNCSLSGELEFSGKFDWSTKNNSLGAGFITVHVKRDLTANLEMEFATGNKPLVLEFEQSFFPIIGLEDGVPLGPGLGIPKIISISPYFDYSVGVSIEVGTPETNVTIGGELCIPQGAKLTWDIVNGDSTEVKGWDVKAKINPVKVNKVNKTDFSLGVNFTSTPAVIVKLEFLKALDIVDEVSAEIGAKLAMALPRLYTKSTLVKDVTEDCTTPGPDEYTYFPYGISFESGLELALYGELFATVQKTFSNAVSVGKGVNWTKRFWGQDYPFNDVCLLFGNSKTGLGELRNTTEASAVDERVFDLKKIEAMYEKTGDIPQGVDTQKLAQVKELPDSLKSALGSDNGQNTNSSVTTPGIKNGVSRLQVSSWTLGIWGFAVLFLDA